MTHSTDQAAPPRPAVPFAQQHHQLQPRVVGHFGTAHTHIDCGCGWTNTGWPTKGRAQREWNEHRNAVRKLSEAAYVALRDSRRDGPIEVRGRTGAALVARGLLADLGGRRFDITPVGLGVLAEHERLIQEATA